VKPSRTKVADLDFEALGLVVQRSDSSIQLRINELQCSVGREPAAQSLARTRPQAVKPSAAFDDMRRLVDERQIESERS
jgi:hypothetical protein